MVVFLDKEQSGKIDPKKIGYVDTEIEKLYYDELSNTTTLLVTISK
jgi:hypothetical protein